MKILDWFSNLTTTTGKELDEKRKQDYKLDSSIKKEKLKRISSACVNAEEFIESKDFLKGLNIVLKLSAKYNINYYYNIFKKLGKKQELLVVEKEDLISFINDNRIRKISTNLLLRLRSKSSLKLKIKNIDDYIKFNDFLQKIFNENGYSEIIKLIGKVSGINKLQEETKEATKKIIEDRGIKGEQSPILSKDSDYINEELETDTLNGEIVDVTTDLSDVKEIQNVGFTRISINSIRDIYYQLGFRVENISNWGKENIFEGYINNDNTILIEESIGKQILVNPDFGSIKKGEISEFIGGVCDGEQLFTFNALTEEANNNGSRIPSVNELDSIIKQEGIEKFIISSPGFRTDKDNKFKLYGKYIHYWTSTVDDNGSNIYISINTITRIIQREKTTDINLGFSPCLVRD